MLLKKTPPIRTYNFLAIITIALTLWLMLPRIVYGQFAPNPFGVTVQTLQRLQPALTDNAAATYSRAINKVATANRVDPYLIAAIVRRESSYFYSIATGKKLGARGEIGLMQVMPFGVALKHAPRGCKQSDALCSLQTGTRYLAALRGYCRGSESDMWIWVASYGMKRCPSASRAREITSARRARSFYCTIKSDCNRHWPR